MRPKKQYNLSQDLEKHLQAAAERIAQSIERGYLIRRAIGIYRKPRQPIEPIPDDVKEWYEETEEFEDE